jgi:multidrug resistance protein MdtO
VRLYEIAAGLPQSTGFLEIIARRIPPRAPIGRLPRFQPGTSFDPAALRLGIKAALAMTLCGLAYQVLLWPGITTCVVTAIIVIQPSRGASMRKALLRSAGAIAGGLFGFLALAVLGPSMGNLPALMIVAGIGIAGAAYVNVGSSRISYAGMQTVMAFGLVALDHETVAGNLTAGIDRVLGILLGIAVATLVDVLMWPTTARAAAAAKVVAAQKGLDALAADPADRATKTAAIHRDLAAAVAQFEDARWEMSSRPADRSALIALGRDIERVQHRFLALTVHPPEATGVVTR